MCFWWEKKLVNIMVPTKFQKVWLTNTGQKESLIPLLLKLGLLGSELVLPRWDWNQLSNSWLWILLSRLSIISSTVPPSCIIWAQVNCIVLLFLEALTGQLPQWPLNIPNVSLPGMPTFPALSPSHLSMPKTIRVY